MIHKVGLVTVAAGLATMLPIATRGWAGQKFALDSTKGLQPYQVTVEPMTYQGRKAVRVMPLPAEDAAWAAGKTGSGGGIVVLPDATFHNGTIEMDRRRQAPQWGAGRSPRLCGRCLSGYQRCIEI